MCDEQIDECVSAPCQNGAPCVDGINQFRCRCGEGYEGERCETDINECVSRPCLNGGTCSNQPGHFYCTCPTGITGRQPCV